MSANYHQHQLERDLQHRVATLEARVAWLEDVLGRVLGQAPADAAPPVAALPDRFMLRTQPLSALAGVAEGVGGISANDAPALAPAPPLLDAFTLLEGTAAPAAIPRDASGAFSTDVFIPAAPARAPTLNLGITAAFETLEGKIAQAADAELQSVRRRGPAAPAIAIRPDLMDPRAPAPRKLEVCCALELLNPSILQQVCAMWGKPECAPRLLRLIGEDFGGRMGLDPQVREELQLLAAMSNAR